MSRLRIAAASSPTTSRLGPIRAAFQGEPCAAPEGQAALDKLVAALKAAPKVPQDIRVQGTVIHRVERHILGRGLDGLTINHDLDLAVEERAGAKLAGQFLQFNVDSDGFGITTVNNGGHAAFTTQNAAGSLASLRARLGRQGKRVAHKLAFRKHWIST